LIEGTVVGGLVNVASFYPSQIPDPKASTKERGEKNVLSYI
jgi:hypothetical protein